MVMRLMRLVALSPIAPSSPSASASTTVDSKSHARTHADRVAALYDELFPAIYRFVRFRLRDEHLAEDVTARVFERALGQMASLRDPNRVRAWLFAIARNLVADARRAPRSSVGLDAVDDDPSSWVGAPDDDVLSHEARLELLRCVSRLDTRARDLIGLRYAAGLRNREIAAATGLSEANVAQILRRALKRLRDLMGPEAHENQLKGSAP